MTTSTPAAYRLRLAIASPEIEARIRGVFASRGLDAVLDDSPVTIEITVVPGKGASPAPNAMGDALRHLVGTDPHGRLAASRAQYWLALAAASRDTEPAPARRVSTGVADLSVREAQVMACIARGLRNAEIAAELGVAVKTVKNHVNRIFAKLGTSVRVEAVLVWQAARPPHPEVRLAG